MKLKQEIRNILLVLISILLLSVISHVFGLTQIEKIHTIMTTMYENPIQGSVANLELRLENLKFLNYEIDTILLILFLIIVYRTITKLSNHIDRNKYLTDTLKVIRDVNKLILRETEVDHLLQKSCDILASSNIYAGAWIITLDANNDIEHCFGADASGNFASFKEKIANHWIPPCIASIDKSKKSDSTVLQMTHICPECPLQSANADKNCFYIEIKHDEKLYGYLNFAIDKKYSQESEETRLLEDVAGDIAYALYNAKHEKSALDLKNLYDNVINSVENIIFVKDKNFVYIACNSAFEKFLGTTKNKIIGKTDYEFFSKEVADSFRKHDEQMTQSNHAQSNYEWLPYPDGSYVYALTTKSPLLNSLGEVVGLVGNSVDLTEQNHIHELFLQAQSFAKIGNWEHDLTSGIVTASDETLQICGFSDLKMQLTKNTFTDLCHPDDRDAYHQALRNSLNKKGMSIHVNRILRNGDGEVRYLEHRWITKYKGEKAVKTVGTTQDVTSRVKQEETLRISNEKFKKSFNQTPNIIIITNLKTGEIYDVNKTFEKVFGFKKKEVIGKTTFDIDLWTNPEDRNRYIDTFKKYSLVEGDIYHFNKKNKTQITANVYASLITIENEEYVLAIAEDITQKQETLRLLEQSKQELETIIQEAPNPIMVFNEEGEILFINKIFLKLTGYARKEIDTMDKWTRHAYGEKSSLLKEYFQNAYTSKHKIDEGEIKIRTKDAKTLIWQFNSAPLGLMEGKRTIISSIVDVTELKRKDELMILQSRHAAMGEMIGMIAHQWRQPITVIAMGANNMLADIALNEFDIKEAEEASNNILAQTQHLSKTIDDFRNFFKSDKELLKVDMKDILSETYSILKDSLLNNSINLETTYDTDIKVEVYPRELMQVFVNIINNAKDVLVSKKIKNAYIKVRVYNDAEYVITEICDNGEGIEQEMLSKIFDPYFSTKDEKNGTGLGLYMSKTIIEDHLKGKLEVSNRDRGACFSIKLKQS